jgi:phosphoribosylformimino-5-aminoimidazole carboxamide ribonucleotide (ProFAR) isomerase
VFEVIPAIDVSGGRLAAYAPDGPRPIEAFEGDPLRAAVAYAGAGARLIHVVDLDLAFEGEARNLGVVTAISGLGVLVQGSGGIADLATAERILAAGADRVVLGSAALADERSTLEVVAALGRRVVVGIEIQGDRIRGRGPDAPELPIAETLGWLSAGGAPAFLVTSVARVGALAGPDLAAVRRVLRAGRPVLAAGGIASLDDLRALRRLGAAGAVVGRAALEGGVALAAALELA